MEPILTSACRRAVLMATAGCAVATVTGCASYGQTAPAAAPPATELPTGTSTGTPTGAPAESAPEPSESDPAEPAAAAENALIPLDRVPVGGGVILADQGIVLSRPTADSVLGFSAVCTHAGCSVAAIKGRNVVCPCHGSRFRLADGSVQAGPATRSLDAIGVRVEAGQVLRD